jgi:hypothetical protein
MLASPSAGQSLVSPAQPIVGSSLDLGWLRDLPTSHTPLSVLETIQVQSIADGFTTGGLNPATALKVGAYLNSWNQTQVLVGDVVITDPRIGGVPLLVPTLATWDRVTTVTGGMAVDDRAPGLSVTLQPRRPGSTWVREIEGAASGSLFVTEGRGPIPVVDRPTGFWDGAALASGPISDRLGVVAAASWRRLSHVAAPSPEATTDSATSAFAHLVFAATPRDEVRTLAWAQRLSTEARTDTGFHLQTTWERREQAQSSWRVFGGYTERRRTSPVPAALVVDSLATDPVSDLMDTGEGIDRRWTVGARLAPEEERFFPALGVDFDRAAVSVPPTGLREIRELVDGRPSRLWAITAGTAADARHVTSLALHASKRASLGRLAVDAGLRFETIAGSADDAVRGVRWTNWLPRVGARFDIEELLGLSFVAAYRRSAYQVPLNMLAVGSPSAPVADVSRWDGVSTGPLIARVGPGTGGDPTLVQIDPDLERPLTAELVLSVEWRPLDGLQVYLARVTKHEHPLLAFTETAIPASEHTPVEVADPLYHPILSPYGGPIVTAFSRPGGSYGRDRYLLTNRADDQNARFLSTEFGVRAERERFDLLFSGVYLSLAHGPAAAVGFRPTQNDQSVLGNLFVDPSDAQYERGQLFQDRSHAGKAAAIFRLPWRTRLGVTARYQDGQPFARVITVPGLTQGPTAVRVAHNGSQAFTFTGTLDVRVQKTITAGRAEMTAVVDIYNLPGMDEEVAEYIVTAPGFRTPTALQPPRIAVVGVRFRF